MNPNDVFPRRNLPDPAEDWGRVVEKRIRGVEFAAMTTKQSTSGLNRTTAASLEELARQLHSLQEVYRITPKPAQAVTRATNFGLTASSWNTVVTTSVRAPIDATHVNLLAVGSAHLFSVGSPTNPGDTQYRLSFSGVGNSPAGSGAWFFGFSQYEASMAPTYAWSTDTVTPGGLVTVSLQLNPSYSIWPSSTGSYAVLALLATFTG